MPKEHVVELTDEQRQRCWEIVGAGCAPARTVMHAQVLLKTDSGPEGPGWTDQAIAEAFGVTTVTVARLRKTMVTEGLEATLSHYRGPEREYRYKLDGHQEAHLIALACGQPPQGHQRWSLRVNGGRIVRRAAVEKCGT